MIIIMSVIITRLIISDNDDGCADEKTNDGQKLSKVSFLPAMI